MSNQNIDEVCEILEYITNENSVPRNIREAANESNKLLKDDEKDQSVRISTVLGKLDEISNDPNIPVHARTLIWEVLSKLESILGNFPSSPASSTLPRLFKAVFPLPFPFFG